MEKELQQYNDYIQITIELKYQLLVQVVVLAVKLMKVLEEDL